MVEETDKELERQMEKKEDGDEDREEDGEGDGEGGEDGEEMIYMGGVGWGSLIDRLIPMPPRDPVHGNPTQDLYLTYPRNRFVPPTLPSPLLSSVLIRNPSLAPGLKRCGDCAAFVRCRRKMVEYAFPFNG